MEIAQESRAEPGQDWWHWSVWIEASESELDDITFVDWHLHPTFPDPVRRRTNRDEQFRLDASGWGEFEVRAEVDRGGAKTLLSHQLILFSAAAPGPDQPRKTVMVSGSPIDRDAVAKVASELTDRGYRVMDSLELDSVEMHEATGLDADLVVEVVDDPKAWSRQEVQVARESGIPVIRSLAADVAASTFSFDAIADEIARSIE